MDQSVNQVTGTSPVFRLIKNHEKSGIQRKSVFDHCSLIEEMYSNHLKTRPNGRFVSSCQMLQYLNGGLKTGLKTFQFWVFGIQMVTVLSGLSLMQQNINAQ